MEFRAAFRGSPLDVPEARRLVRRRLEQVADSDALDIVLVLVSELATNAVVHGRTEFSVEVSWDDAVAHVAVQDGNTRIPERPEVPIDAASGRGLSLVDAAALQWGIDEHPAGKVVWFDARLPRAG